MRHHLLLLASGLLIGATAAATAAPVLRPLSEGASAVVRVNDDDRNDGYDRDRGTVVDVPGAYVDTRRGTVVDAPGAHVEVEGNRVRVRAPFVNLNLPR